MSRGAFQSDGAMLQSEVMLAEMMEIVRKYFFNFSHRLLHDIASTLVSLGRLLVLDLVSSVTGLPFSSLSGTISLAPSTLGSGRNGLTGTSGELKVGMGEIGLDVLTHAT
jgi:hypothetical protein